MHSSQFGITFTDSRGPVNSDGPIHCIRSLNRMVRYSVMPLPVIITTDGSQDAFGAVLSQKFEYTLPSGKVVCKRHPIGFASKRTSKTEEKYKLFLLEFGALKFGLDKFSDTMWGFPIEVETDWEANTGLTHDIFQLSK